MKIAGSAQKKTGSVGLAETHVFFLGLSNTVLKEVKEKIIRRQVYYFFIGHTLYD